MANILILGGGFAGLMAAERLSEKIGAGDQITVVSGSDKFTFYPELVRLAHGFCEPGDIAFDLRARLEELNVRFVRAEVLRVDFERRHVDVVGDDIKGEISFDYLLIALGRRLATEKIPGFFEYAQNVLSSEGALEFGEEIRNFEHGNIVLGMSPEANLPLPVCESAFALARQFKQRIADEVVTISAVFPGKLQDAFGGADIHDELAAAFEKHGILLVEDFAVQEIDKNVIKATNGQVLSWDLLMLLPPFHGQTFLCDESIFDENGFVVTDDRLRVKNVERVYAIGDIVAFSGPKLAQMAVIQARIAADNVLSEINGEDPVQYYYHEIATIIDAGGADSIYLHYGIWDETLYKLRTGNIWRWVKRIHDKLWLALHQE